MSSQALARTWRPKNFESIVGQEHVVKGLTYALSHNRLHHAYLFTGTRGVGKTTLARIFAKCLSCEKGVSPAPCGICTACTQIDQGSFFDLIEIDAASRTKVEDTRDLLDNVQYAPTVGRFKIYLIDEVHMLSTHSFNALLKTLEEPPSHVKFLLATTDPQKLPVTVLSRCLQYHLRALTHAQLVSHLQDISTKEGVSFNSESLSMIAYSAKGSARDGLSLLDQAISFTGGDLREDLVSQMLGVIPQSRMVELAESVAKGDKERAIAQVDALKESWIDFEGLLKELARFWQECALIQSVRVETSTHFEKAKLLPVAASVDSVKLQFFYEVCVNMQSELAFAPDPFCGFEMAVLRMLMFTRLESFHSEPPPQSNYSASPSPPIRSTKEKSIPAKNTLVNQLDLKADWKKFIDSLGMEGIVRQVAVNTSVHQVSEHPQGLKISLEVDKKNEGLLTERILHRLAGAIGIGLGQKIFLAVHSTDGRDLKTPAKQLENEVLKREELAHQTIVSDLCVQEIQEAFSAQIDTNTVQLIDKR